MAGTFNGLGLRGNDSAPVEIKDLTLPDNMQRAMAKQAEAERAVVALQESSERIQGQLARLAALSHSVRIGTSFDKGDTFPSDHVFAGTAGRDVVL